MMMLVFLCGWSPWLRLACLLACVLALVVGREEARVRYGCAHGGAEPSVVGMDGARVIIIIIIIAKPPLRKKARSSRTSNLHTTAHETNQFPPADVILLPTRWGN